MSIIKNSIAPAQNAVASSNAAPGFTVQEGGTIDITAAQLISAATVSGATAPLFITSVDSTATDGFVVFDPVADAVDFTAGGYLAGAPTGSFGYTVSDGTTTWTQTASIDITSTQPGMQTVAADPAATTMTVSGYDQRIVMSDAATCTLSGPQGSSTVFAGSGADTISLSGYTNLVYGGPGGDTIYAGQGTDTVIARDGDNTIVAGGYNNTVSAGNGNDVVLGAQGNTTVTLGDGNQTVVLFGYGNTVTVGDGSATAGLLGKLSYINAGDGSATVTAGNGTDIVIAGGYQDTITVGDGTNLIFATGQSGGLDAPANLPAGYTGTQASLGDCAVSLGNGNDWVYLQGYGNTVDMGSGLDAIWGGAGNDTFAVSAGGGASFIANFSLANGDRLDLSKILDGVALAPDLTNIGSFVKVVGHGLDDAAFGAPGDGGTNTQLAITGLNGTAMVNIENTGSMSLGNLVSHHSLIFAT